MKNTIKQVRKDNTAKIVKEMLGIKNAVTFYVLDTGVFQNNCRLDCTEATGVFAPGEGELRVYRVGKN